MNIRQWDVWTHPTRDDMLMHAPRGVPSRMIETVYIDSFIKQAASRGGARIYLEKKGYSP